MTNAVAHTIFGQHDQKTIDQFKKCLNHPSIHSAAMSADGHVGYGAPVGGIFAYYDHINLNAVGVDIGCGNKAAMLDLKGSDIKNRQWSKLADDLARKISFGIGRISNEPVDHPVLEEETWSLDCVKGLRIKARNQLSTCGSGNHFVDLFTDQDDNVWIGVHFGSRGLGHGIAMDFIQRLGGRDGIDADPVVVSTLSDIGRDYVAAMQLAGRYAYAGRDIVVDFIAKEIIGAKIVDEVHLNHNFAWQEKHGGEMVWVIRKGATPCAPGQRGFVGGSMGDNSVILKGIDSEASRQSLYSTVHGAGRVMSRTQAAGKSKWIKDEVTGKKVKTRVAEGLVNEDSMRQRIKNQGIELRGAGPDEAPEVYRRLHEVLEYHAGTIEIERQLTPKVVVMAGDSTFDPYKD